MKNVINYKNKTEKEFDSIKKINIKVRIKFESIKQFIGKLKRKK